jgi:hypothetical protein
MPRVWSGSSVNSTRAVVECTLYDHETSGRYVKKTLGGIYGVGVRRHFCRAT